MKGVYVLLIKVNKKIQQKIGSLGKINFNKGIYAYIGSAQNNLEKRIARHKMKDKIKFWHIDYLLSNKNVKILKVFYKNSQKSEECKIARTLTKTERFIPKFGCSDCTCKSHLFEITDLKNILNLGVNEL